MGEYVLISKEDIKKWRNELTILLDKIEYSSAFHPLKKLLKVFEELEEQNS